LRIDKRIADVQTIVNQQFVFAVRASKYLVALLTVQQRLLVNEDTGIRYACHNAVTLRNVHAGFLVRIVGEAIKC